VAAAAVLLASGAAVVPVRAIATSAADEAFVSSFVEALEAMEAHSTDADTAEDDAMEAEGDESDEEAGDETEEEVEIDAEDASESDASAESVTAAEHSAAAAERAAAAAESEAEAATTSAAAAGVKARAALNAAAEASARASAAAQVEAQATASASAAVAAREYPHYGDGEGVEVTITYCSPCGFYQHVTKLSMIMTSRFPLLKVTLVPNERMNYAFEVKIDDDIVYNKVFGDGWVNPEQVERLLYLLRLRMDAHWPGEKKAAADYPGENTRTSTPANPTRSGADPDA